MVGCYPPDSIPHPLPDCTPGSPLPSPFSLPSAHRLGVAILHDLVGTDIEAEVRDGWGHRLGGWRGAQSTGCEKSQGQRQVAIYSRATSTLPPPSPPPLPPHLKSGAKYSW